MKDSPAWSRRGVRLTLLVGLLLVIVAGVARAGDPQHNPAALQSNATSAAAPELVVTMRLYEGVLRTPLPLWIKTPKQIGDMKMYRNQQKNLFTFEVIPKAQEFAKWTRLLGVYGFYLPDYDLKRFFNDSLNALSLGCKAHSHAHILSAGDHAIALEFYCPELRPEVVTGGNSVERSFLFISHTGKSYAKVYRAWRGPANAQNATDWPTNPQVEREAVESMRATRFSPAK